MGTLLYGTALTLTFDDRVLAHLQVVIVQKLRRHDSFLFSWKESQENGGGRAALWMNHNIPIIFNYQKHQGIHLNAVWVDILARSANSPQGLMLTGEPHNDDSNQIPALG